MTCSLAAPLQGPVSLTIPFSSQSAGQVRQALTSWMQFQSAPEPMVQDALLVVTELVANAVRHADPLGNGAVLVRWSRDGANLVLSVSDGGGPTRPEVTESGPQDESGRGLAIVEALSLSWHIERTNRVHVVHVHLPLA